MISKNVENLVQFMTESPSSFQAVETMCRMLQDAGFSELQENARWQLERGGKYYVTRNRSSLIAFSLPQGPYRGYQIVAAHSDSPAFKIKERAELTGENHYVRLDTEKYGGMIDSTWFDRPLSVAGRILVRTDTGVRTIPVNLNRDMLLIPNVAIHLNRSVNDGYKYQPHIDLMPLWGSAATKGSFRKTVAEAAGVSEEDIVGSDLYLYNREAPRVWGVADEFISSGHLDDLECAFAGMQALLQSAPRHHASVCAVFDNEEIGSGTKQGAHATFLKDVLKRVNRAFGGDAEDYMTELASSFMISADNAHATHPNHPELSDPINRVYMNEGIVIKFNSRKYSTDGVSEAIFRELCRMANIPVQSYANRSDIAGGSTLGNISGTQVSINTVDIGLAQLAMHSSYETAGTKDVDYLIDALRLFYSSDITALQDGEYNLENDQ